MALNIKDPVTEQLAARVAELAHENKTQAIRTALAQRLERLEASRSGTWGRHRLAEFMATQVWPALPQEQLGRPVSGEEEAAVLGYGVEGW